MLGVPGHVHEQLDGVLHRLQVAYIQDPEFLDTAVIGQLQLFPHVLRRSDVDPFRVTGGTHVVHVVVETPATFTLLFLSRRQSAHVTPVIVAEQHRHIVGHAQTGIIVILYLFIEGPDLWCLLGRALGHLLDDAALVVDDVLQQFRVRAVTHRLVTVATHADGHDVVGAVHTLDTLTEETVKVLLVGRVVPSPPTLTVTGILLVVTCHRLMVGGTHHDTHCIGGLQVLRVVGIESPAPHGRPQVVTFQAQDEFKHLGIEMVVAIVCTEGVLHPGGQTGCLIVEEQTTIAHSGFAVGELTFLDIEVGMLLHGNIGPVVPR